jgi:transposase
MRCSSCPTGIRVLPYWPRERFLELAPKFWVATRARLDPRQLADEVGLIDVPPPMTDAPQEQPASTGDAA